MRSKFSFLYEQLPEFDAWSSDIHGHDHWMRVVQRGLDIASHTAGVDATVVELFGMLHDTHRQNDGNDPHHGPRAAKYLDSIVGELYISKTQYKNLRHALEHHTDEIHNNDPTIGACYDADRLDLGRVGITPDPDYLNTTYAKSIASDMYVAEID